MSRLKQNMVFALLMALVGSASAVTVEFDNGSGDGTWANPVNWAGDALPTSADTARLTAISGTTVLDSTTTVGDLLGGHVGTSALDVISGGTLNIGNIQLGTWAAGTIGNLSVNGGTIVSSGFLRAGLAGGSFGNVAIQSGSASFSGASSIGYNGTGTLDITGGALSFGTIVRIGHNANSSGTVTMSGGSLTVSSGALVVGAAGNGSFELTGGTASLSTLEINATGAAINARVDLLGGVLDLGENGDGALDIGGDDVLNIEAGTLRMAGDRLSLLDGYVASNSITWANGQSTLGAFDQSWTNGSSILYANFNTINPGKTTVWAESSSGQPPWVDLAALGYVVVTDYPGVRSDGTGDSTAGIQQAIDDAYAQQKTVFFPSGTYLISDTLKCYRWQLWNPWSNKAENPDKDFCHAVWGSALSSNRPVLKLAANAVGFTNANSPRPMMSIRNFKAQNSSATSPIAPSNPMAEPPNFVDAANNLFIDDLRGIDFDCNGNPGAIGFYYPAAQSATVEDVRIDATGAYAGIWGLPGRDAGGMNIEVEGGRFGIIIRESMGGTMLSGIRLFNQTESSLVVEDFVPTTLAGFHIVKAAGPVFTSTSVNWANVVGSLSLIDGVIEVGSNGVVLDNSNGKNLYLRNVYVTGSDQVIQSPTGTHSATGTWKRIREYAYTDQTNPAGDPPYESGDSLFRVFNMRNGVIDQVPEPTVEIVSDSSAPPVDLISRHVYADLPLYEGQNDGTINVSQPPYNAIPNDGLDDRAAIQAAIDAAETNGIGRVFIPRGRFEISDTVTLKSNTILFGVGREKTILAYHDSWQPTTGMVDFLDTVDDASATTFIGFMTLRSRTTGGSSPAGTAPPYDRFNTIHWRVGRDSCFYGINFRALWINRPTNPHYDMKVTGNGGGRIYFLTNEGLFNRAHSGYRALYIEGTREPMWFYGVNFEATKSFQLWGGDPCDTNIEVVDGQNIVFLSLKREGISPGLILRNGRNIALYSSGGMRDVIFPGSGGYLQVLGSSDDILMANLLVQSTGTPNGEPLLLEALNGGSTNQVLYPEGVSLYQRGAFNNFAVSLAIDADEDGMPNDWENTYGFNSLDPQDALLNADGDSLINRDEYIAGTDPQDAGSNFKASLPSSGQGVAFESALGRLYSVESKGDLLEASWQVLTNNWEGTAGWLEYNDSTGTNFFYRIKVNKAVP